jgi:hypothetical protein
LPKEWFSTYITKGTSYGVNATLFYKVLKKREKSQTIHILCDGETESMSFHFTGNDKTIFDKHFEMPLVDVESDLLEIPHIVHQAEFSLSTDKFCSLIMQLKDFGDTLEVECSEENITLCSHSSENGRMKTEIPIDDLDEFSIDEGEKIRIEFALKFLYDICQYQRLTKRIEIKVSENFPMMLIYRLGASLDELPDEKTDEIVLESTCNSPRMVFYLAPKVSDD